MTQIVATERAIIRLIESCDFPGVTVMSAPHEWDNSYLQRLLGQTPAVLVAFEGAEPFDDASTILDCAGSWGVFIAVGWNGAGQEERRLGAGAGFDLMHRVGAAIHGAQLVDENGDMLTDGDGEPVRQPQVAGLGVESDAALDVSNLWIGSVAVTVPLRLLLQAGDACYGPLDAWLEARATFDLPGGKPAPAIEDAGTEGDVGMIEDLPQ